MPNPEGNQAPQQPPSPPPPTLPEPLPNPPPPPSVRSKSPPPPPPKSPSPPPRFPSPPVEKKGVLIIIETLVLYNTSIDVCGQGRYGNEARSLYMTEVETPIKLMTLPNKGHNTNKRTLFYAPIMNLLVVVILF